MMRIKFKLYKEEKFFSRGEFEIVEGILLGCIGDVANDYLKVWYNKEVISIKGKDLVEVLEEQRKGEGL